MGIVKRQRDLKFGTNEYKTGNKSIWKKVRKAWQLSIGAGNSTGRPKKLPKEVEEDLLAEVQRLRAENDYRVNLKAEIMIEDLYDKVNAILARQTALEKQLTEKGESAGQK